MTGKKHEQKKDEKEPDKQQEDAEEKESRPFDFSSSHTDNFPGILSGLNISLAVTSYQSSCLFLVRSNGEVIDTNFVRFMRPMGICADSHRLTLGTFTEVVDFRRCDDLLEQIKAGEMDSEEELSKKVLEKNKKAMEELIRRRNEEISKLKEADALYLPRMSLTTGMINIHDIAWGTEGLWVVNSTFSCLATLQPDHSFVARWKPHFITELKPEDRCHLNGMAIKDGKPGYVTTFTQSDELDSWSDRDSMDGTLMDVERNEILLDGLLMPHSPRYYRGHVYLCDSGTGRVLKYCPDTGEVSTLIQLQGFPRGMNFFGPLMFVGLSKIRASENRHPLPVDEMFDETYSGVWVVNLETGDEVAHIRFEGDVEQIYDIALIPEANYPAMLPDHNPLIRHLFDFREEVR